MKYKRVSFRNPIILNEFSHICEDSECQGKINEIAKRALREIIKEQLSERQKQFIVLYYYEYKTMKEISEICDVNISTVSRTLNRARKNIADRIKYYYIK